MLGKMGDGSDRQHVWLHIFFQQLKCNFWKRSIKMLNYCYKLLDQLSFPRYQAAISIHKDKWSWQQESQNCHYFSGPYHPKTAIIKGRPNH